MTHPNGWKIRELGEILDVQNGYAFDSSLFSTEDGMPLIRIRDLKGGCITAIRFRGSFDEKYVVSAGDFLIGMDGEFRCYEWAGKDALLNQRVCRLVDFSEEIDPGFVGWGINSHLMAIEERTPFVTVKHISSKSIKEIKFAYPSKDKQRKIVAKIKECMERVDEIKTLRDESLKERSFLIESLVEAELQTLDGSSVHMSDVAEITSSMVDPRNAQYQSFLHVGGANIESKTGRLVNVKTAADENLKSGKFTFDQSMVLYNKIRPYLMKSARPDFSGLCSADMYPLSPKAGRITRDFLYYVLMSRQFTDYAISGSNRAGMPKVNREHLFAYSFTLPSLEVQKRITAQLDNAVQAVLDLEGEMTTAQTETTMLRDAILRKAFAGEL